VKAWNPGSHRIWPSRQPPSVGGIADAPGHIATLTSVLATMERSVGALERVFQRHEALKAVVKLSGITA
jgi:hypothetical protein